MTAPIIPLFKPHSGKTPESAPRGSRQSVHKHADPAGPEPHPTWLGVISGEIGMWLLILALAAACILVGAL